MGGPHRPPCPCCGSPLWKTHKKFWLKCPKCGHRFKIDDPRLVLHTLSNLADRRATFIVASRGGVAMMASTRRRIKPCAFIESQGGVLYEEFTDVAPTEFKVRSREKRRRDQEAAWADFDHELREKLRRNELGVDPGREVRKNGA